MCDGGLDGTLLSASRKKSRRRLVKSGKDAVESGDQVLAYRKTARQDADRQ
jgi:hypothetical protein